MITGFTPWRHGIYPGPPRFGLDAESWHRLLMLHAEVADGIRTEWPSTWAPPRMQLVRWMVRTGRIHD